MNTTTESATSTATTKEGVEIKGKDVIKLTAPEILPPAGQLLTNAQDIVGAINELFQEGTGANGAFRAVWDDNAGALAIVVQEGEKYADYQFGYEYTDYSDEITTQTVVNGEKVKTTRSFSKRIVTSLFDASGAVLLATEYNADNGAILGYTDGSGEVVHTAEWRAEYESVVSQSPGASSAAIAWCIARNMEQSSSLTEEKQAYKDGLKVGVEGGADITEEYEQNTTTLNITPDGTEGAIDKPFIGNLTDGIYYTASDGSYVHMYLDTSWSTTQSDGTIKTGQMVYEAYDNSGALIDTATSIGTSGWAWTRNKYDEHVVNVAINGSDVTCTHAQTVGIYGTKYYNIDWSPSGSTIKNIMANAVKVGNIPPEIIN